MKFNRTMMHILLALRSLSSDEDTLACLVVYLND
jgi:hypothetical protein